MADDKKHTDKPPFKGEKPTHCKECGRLYPVKLDEQCHWPECRQVVEMKRAADALERIATVLEANRHDVEAEKEADILHEEAITRRAQRDKYGEP